MRPLYAGVARVDITPPPGAFLTGWAERRPSDRVHRPLYAQALVLESRGMRACIVTLDLLGIDPPLVERIRAAIEGSTGLRGADVMVHCSHTHSAPVVMRFRQANVPDPDPAYVAGLIPLIAGAALRATQDLQPVAVGVGTGHVDFAVNRRRRGTDGRVGWPPRAWPEGAVDHAVTVVRLTRPDQSTLAVLMHYTCHPTIGGPSLWIGPDYVGAARAAVEEADPGATAFFLQGTTGNVRGNLTHDDGRFRWEVDMAEVDMVGRKLGAEVVRVLQTTAGVPAEGIGVAARRLPFYLADGSQGGSAELQSLVFGPVTIVANPAEPFVETGLALKHTLGPGTLPLGYTNGFIGYVATRAEFPAGGYEVDLSYKSWEYASPIQVGTAETFTEAQAAVAAEARSLAREGGV